MLVLTAVSSINTSRAGSSMPCSRIQRRRARATSDRCRSAACRLFLKVAPCRPKNRESALRLVRIRRLSNSTSVSFKVRSGRSAISANISLLMRFQWRYASSSRFRRCASAFVPALQPSDSRTDTDPKAFGRLAPRCPLNLHRLDHAFPQVTRIGLRHCIPRKGESMTKDSLNPSPLGILPIQIGRNRLVSRFRRSYHLAEPALTNVGNKGTLASHDPSVALHLTFL